MSGAPPSLTDREAMILRPAATVAGSANLRDAVIAEGRNRRLALILMLMSLATGADETETTALEPAP